MPIVLTHAMQGQPMSTAAAPATLNIISSLLAVDPSLAISVWRPRSAPEARFTATLLCFNQAFLSLNDTVAFKDSTVSSVLVQNPICLYDDTAEQLRAGIRVGVLMVDAIHSGEAMHIRGFMTRASHVGRIRKVSVEIVAVRVGARLIEFISAEAVLPPDVPMPSGLNPAGVAPSFPSPSSPFYRTVVSARSISPPSANPPQRALAITSTSGEVPGRQRFRWDTDRLTESSTCRPPSHSGNSSFRCSVCRTTQTTQKRRGPHGPHTLCNRCGLQWRKVSDYEVKLRDSESTAVISKQKRKVFQAPESLSGSSDEGPELSNTTDIRQCV